MTKVRHAEDLDVQGKRVFLRVDFNVPLATATEVTETADKNADTKIHSTHITDDTRIRAALPTIESLLERGARLVIGTHLGRPKGERLPALSVEPVAARLAEFLACGEVRLTDQAVGDGVRKVVDDLREGQVAMLENLRFYKGETTNDDIFAEQLASFTDVYINEAFGVAHREHASISALPKHIRERGAGALMLRELNALGQLQRAPQRPYVAVLGGAKVSSKIRVLEALSARVNTLCIGGAMANTFLATQGRSVGKSLVEPEQRAFAYSLLQRAQQNDVQIMLPTDVRITKSAGSHRSAGLHTSEADVVSVDSVPANATILDIGPDTEAQFAQVIRQAQSIFWNGPMGLFENPIFAHGTLAIAQAASLCTGFSVVGGGDSVAAVRQTGLLDAFSHVSTGGGASLQYIQGGTLVGIEALR